MSFLQPWLLLALPLVALPIIIHLINQWRFQTVPWGAMMFLLAAHRMARGYSRLRQWLIMALRMLAVAALVFGIARPLASGWLGSIGGRPDTTIIVLDRSPSMQQRDPATGETKLDRTKRQLVSAVETIGSNRWVLVESTAARPRLIESPRLLLEMPETNPTSAPADLPRMLQAVHEYVRDNNPGHAEVWIASDLQQSDWNAGSGQWKNLHDAFLAFPQTIRFRLLALSEPAPANLSVRVTDVRRRSTADQAELLISLIVTRHGNDDTRIDVPLQFDIEGARSGITLELSGAQVELSEHSIPIERGQTRGWGRVSIPADANPADNDYFFVFDEPPPRSSVIVSDDTDTARILELIAGIAPDPSIECQAERIAPDQLTSVIWEQLALIVWHAPLPSAPQADLLQSFVDRGGRVIFLPPRDPDDAALFGVHWTAWVKPDEPARVEEWRNDTDLFARTQSGASLPVGQLEVHRYCGLEGEFTTLASLPDGNPLLVRAPSRQGGVYFVATSPALSDSSLATSGVVLYAFVQRALADGAAALNTAQQLEAGSAAERMSGESHPLAQADPSLSTEYPYYRGVYSSGDYLYAVNRPPSEDDIRQLDDARLAQLFGQLNYVRIDSQSSSTSSLIQEISQAFLLAMLVALIGEGLLCLPKRARSGSSTRP